MAQVLSIPLAATLMARGVWYAEWLPWQAGAAAVALALGGLGYKYVKEALEWTEPTQDRIHRRARIFSFWVRYYP